MLVRVAIFAALLLVPGLARADLLTAADRQHYRNAFDHARKGHYRDARLHAARARDKTLAKVVDWLELTRPGSGRSFDEIVAFHDANPDWPNLHHLRLRAEDSIATLSDAELRAWFERQPPMTPHAKFRRADMLMNDGQRSEAAALVREAWITGEFGAAEEKVVLQRYAGILRTEDHVKRLDRLVWDGNDDAAKRQYARVPAEWKTVAEARLKLQGLASNAEKLLADVPAKLRNDPGLLYERARYLRRKDRPAEAIEIIGNAPKEMGRPSRWWDERQMASRRALQDGNAQLAYRLAARHGLDEGVPFFEGEFLAGWIALRFLNDPKTAYDHFVRLHDAASFPISVARGAYWAGRAAEAKGDRTAASRWYTAASQHQATYYGQLAAAAMGSDAPPKLVPEPTPSKEQIAAFDRREVVRVARMLAEIGEADRAKPFVLRLGDTAKTPGEHALAARLAEQMGRLDLSVSLAKKASYVGVPLMQHGYPVLAIDRGGVAEKPLVLAMTRQESAFDIGAVSRSGARGLMQLMPTTAKEVAKQQGVAYNADKLLRDPGYNLKLGRAFLDGLLERFGGSYVLSVAAYNAGPGRVWQWVEAFGDPRDGKVDAVDWVELIPFNETRNYVQRVLENLQVYRVRLGDAQLAFSLPDDLRR